VTGMDREHGWKPRWTAEVPQVAVFSHLTNIAKTCVLLMQQVIAGDVGDEGWEQLFKPNLAVFDVVLECAPAVLPPVHDGEVALSSAVRKRVKSYKVKVFKNLLVRSWPF